IDTKVLGLRPGGELAENSPLLAAVQAADDYLGNRARIEQSSTDANIPLSLGIPAIAFGAGGTSGGAHSLQEWYDPTGREIGMQRVLLTLLQVAGLNPPMECGRSPACVSEAQSRSPAHLLYPDLGRNLRRGQRRFGQCVRLCLSGFAL